MAKFSILACTIVVCSLMLVYSSLQAQSQKIQAQQLVDSTVKKNTDIAGLEVSAIPPGKTTCATIAATEAKELGEKCDEDEFAALKTGKPHFETEADGHDITAPARREWKAGWNHRYRFQVAVGSNWRIHPPAHR
jgi:hypothetical protein